MLELIISATLLITGILTVEESKKTISSSQQKTITVTIYKSEKTNSFKSNETHWDKIKLNHKFENEKATI